MRTKGIHNIPTVSFPTVRLRRLRRTPAIRDLLQEIRLSAKDLICPLFIQDGIDKPQVIESVPHIYRIPITKIIKEVETIADLGIRGIILFGIPSYKDNEASSAFDDNGIVQQSVEVISKHLGGKIAITTDVCLCQYLSHGHSGIIRGEKVDNDRSISTLAKVAISHAKAGADFVAPSAMMDGQVKAIRQALDDAGSDEIAIMAYSAK